MSPLGESTASIKSHLPTEILKEIQFHLRPDKSSSTILKFCVWFLFFRLNIPTSHNQHFSLIVLFSPSLPPTATALVQFNSSGKDYNDSLLTRFLSFRIFTLKTAFRVQKKSLKLKSSHHTVQKKKRKKPKTKRQTNSHCPHDKDQVV